MIPFEFYEKLCARTQVRGKKDLEEILLRESSGRVNVWALCDEPPLFADNTNKTALKRQTESLKRLAEYLEKQRLLDLELKEVARTQRIAREKTLNQLVRGLIISLKYYHSLINFNSNTTHSNTGTYGIFPRFLQESTG